MSLFFLCGLIPPGYEHLRAKAGNNYSEAAEAFMAGLLSGLPAETRVCNTPFVGAWPQTYPDAFLPSAVYGGNAQHLLVGGCNLPYLKQASRAAKISKWLAKNIQQGDRVLAYTAYPPFMRGLKQAKKRGAVTGLILTDLPQYYNLSEKQYAFSRFKYALFARAFEGWRKSVDKYVVLTQQMAEKLSLAPGQYIVLEGIYGEPAGLPPPPLREPGVILYTGGLFASFGIGELLEAFSGLPAHCRLWVCGGGEAEPMVTEAAGRDSRIQYFGTLPRSEVLQMEARAAVLVNPRLPAGEYTKYSFPSKTMEYLASGTPTVMRRLPGLPGEYEQYLHIPSNTGAQGLRECLQAVLDNYPAALEKAGRGRDFILRQKNPAVQAARVLELLYQ